MQDKKFLTINELAEMLNVKTSWVRRAVFEKRIPFKKMNRLVRFEIEAINQWINETEVKEAK